MDGRGRPGATCERDGAFLVEPAVLERCAGDPLLGALLGGRFGLLEPCVRASSATLFVAHDRLDGDRCVVKVARAKDASADEVLAHRQEATILSRLPAGIAPRLRGSGVDPLESRRADAELPLVAFVALDEAAGVALDDPRMSWPAADAARAAAGVVARLHAARFVHGDLKPEHVFVAPGVATLVDFDAAFSLDEGPPPARRASPAFEAPELADGAPASPASDVYALGCVLYRLAAGRLPFVERSATALREAHRAKIPAALPQETSHPMRRAIERSLSKDPGSRPRDGGELLLALGSSDAV